MKQRSFASDNYSGCLPEMIEEITKVNQGHMKAYGYDNITEQAIKQFKKELNHDVDVNFVFNGTGANVLGLSCATQSFDAVLCASSSHLIMHESTAPETFTNCRLIPLQTDNDGKLEIEIIKKAIFGKGDEHCPQIKVLSIAQPTEYGTVYTLKELLEIGKLLKENDVIFHIDGARFFNAIDYLQCTLSEMTTDVGVDIMSIGGTKIGLIYGEAVVCFNKKISRDIKYRHKQSMQLSSKTRFISAQFNRLLKDKLWQKSANQSNKLAQKLVEGIKPLSEVKITRSVQVNSVFAIIPKKWNDALLKLSSFYVWDEYTNEVRWMCSFDTEEVDVDNFIELIGKLNELETLESSKSTMLKNEQEILTM